MTSISRTSGARLLRALLLATMAFGVAVPSVSAQPAAAKAKPPRTADYIIAVVNQELVTAAELEQRVQQVQAEAKRNGSPLPSDAELRGQLLQALIDERVQITYAREAGARVDDAELDRAVTNVASQNQLTVPQLRERLRTEGVDYSRFRNNVRDQIMVERTREREVNSRIKITDADIDDYLARQRSSGALSQFNIAHILIGVPDNATEAVVAERQGRAASALSRVQSGAPFDAVARQVSADESTRDRGGEIGLRPAARIPEAFVNGVQGLSAGQVSPKLLRTSAGFHVIKLIERRDGDGLTVTQTRARHILLRPSAQLSAQAAARRLEEFKRQVASGAKTFESLAKENSEDGSAAQGGDLGWVSAGAFVPEFEEAMNALPLNGMSPPVESRFGLHLIQVMERRETKIEVKQQREQARAALREQKFEEATADWVKELRARAYVEMREPPQ